MSKQSDLAQLFHDTYERLAPEFGYETREETKQFDPESPNGKLMIAVCGEFLDWHNKQIHEARLNEVQNAYEYWINGRKFIASYFRGRIAQLLDTKESKDDSGRSRT